MRGSASLDCAEPGKVFGMRAVVSGELPEVDVTSREYCPITLIPRDAFLTIVTAATCQKCTFAYCQSTQQLILVQCAQRLLLKTPAERSMDRESTLPAQ